MSKPTDILTPADPTPVLRELLARIKRLEEQSVAPHKRLEALERGLAELTAIVMGEKK